MRRTEKDMEYQDLKNLREDEAERPAHQSQLVLNDEYQNGYTKKKDSLHSLKSTIPWEQTHWPPYNWRNMVNIRTDQG